MIAVPKIQDFDDPSYNPFLVSEQLARQGTVSDIYSELAKLRRTKSVWEMDPRLHFGTAPDGTLEGIRKITVLRHGDVNKILTDAAAFSNKNYEINMGLMFGRAVTTMDPPEHRTYRNLFQRAFMPTIITQWRDHVVPDIVNKLIDKFVDKGRAELINDFALHFPFTFIADMLRLPEESRAIFHKLAFAQTAVRYDPEHALEAGRKLTTYLTELVEHRLATTKPEDNDFVATMSRAEIDGEKLPHDVLISFFRQLMNAAGDTSYHGFSNLLAGLLRHPDQLDAVRKDRSLVDPAIEEALRWEPPIVYVERTPTSEVVIDGVTIRPGDHMSVSIGSANRDETIFDNPDKFDIFRERKATHQSFGLGIHICIGRHLARLEMAIALNAILDRLPNLRLDPAYPEPIVHGVSMRKPKGVHVLFG